MKACKCGQPTEAAIYNQCYDCWWSEDPRNALEVGKTKATPAQIRHMKEALERVWAFLDGSSGDSLNGLRYVVAHALRKEIK